MPHTPYNTGKVKIGIYYTPKPRNFNTEETDYWQAILLGERQDRGELWRWVALLAAAFCFGYWALR